MCRDQSLKREQNASRWGNCEQMICMFACSMFSCKLSPFLSSLGPASGSLPPSGLRRSVKVEVPDLGLLHCKYEEWKRGQGPRCCSQSSSLQQSTRTWHAEAGRQHDPTAVWPWETGLSLEIPFQSFEFASSLKAAFSVIQGEGRSRSYFWAGSWGQLCSPTRCFAHCYLLFEVASAELERGCGGSTCTGTTQPVWRRPKAHKDGGGRCLPCSPHQVAISEVEASDRNRLKGSCWRNHLRKKLPVCPPFLTSCGDGREHKHQRFVQTDSDSNQFLPVG